MVWRGYRLYRQYQYPSLKLSSPVKKPFAKPFLSRGFLLPLIKGFSLAKNSPDICLVAGETGQTGDLISIN